MNILNVLIF